MYTITFFKSMYSFCDSGVNTKGIPVFYKIPSRKLAAENPVGKKGRCSAVCAAAMQQKSHEFTSNKRSGITEK
jgi:hypothetical protein